jgi:hypothetical protein
MYKFKLHGTMYEPFSDGTYTWIHIWEVIEAEDLEEALEIFCDLNGELYVLEFDGFAETDVDEESYLKKNDSARKTDVD